jgi:hypothetical protein
MMKFPTEEGVGEVKGDQVMYRMCYNTSMQKVSNSITLTVSIVDKAKGEPIEPLEDVMVEEGKTLKIGTYLTTNVRDSLINFLRQNMEVFAWTHEDMPGISQEDIIHHLNLDSTMKPVKQKRRKFALKRNATISNKIEKLLKAKFIQVVC